MSISLQDWLPNEKSAIFVDDFKSPRDLANFIEELNGRDDLYNRYLLHKTAAKVENRMLKRVITSRPWNGFDSVVEKFECDVCLALHEPDGLRKSVHHGFQCEPPTSMLAKRTNESNFWNAIVGMDRCRGHAVYKIVSNNEALTEQAIEDRVKLLVASGEC